MKKVFLNYYQVAIFMQGVKAIRMSNPNFSDEVLDSFISYVRIRSAELSSLKPNFMSKIIPGYDKFMIPQNMYEYLRELTGVDPMDKETAEAYLTLIEPVVEAAGVKLNKTVPEFNYEDLDFNNKAQMEALKELRNDPEFQRYFNLFQPDFDSYLESLKKNKYLKDAQCFVMQDGKYIGWLNSSIYKEDSKKKTLLDIFVFQAFRGKGLAKKIILDYINYAQLDEILIEVRKSNVVSQKLAISLGFEPYKIEYEEGMIYYRLDCGNLKDKKQTLEN